MHLRLKNPYCVWDTLMIVAIYYMGVLFRKYNLLQRFVNSWVTIACIIGMVVIYALGGIVRFQSTMMPSNNLLLFLLVPMLGVAMLYGMSCWINSSKISSLLAACGEYSFEIMALHFISFKLVAMAHVYFTGSDWSHLADFPVYVHHLSWWTPAYVVVGCALPILLTCIVRKVRLKIASR